MPAVVAAVQITSPSHHDATQIRETFYNLAAAKANNGGKIDDETEASVNRILKLVGETLMAALWEDRDAAQRNYNASVVAVNGCNSDLIDNKLPVYANRQSKTGQDWAAFGECLDDENEACQNKTDICNDLDKFVCDMEICNDSPLNNVECVQCKEETPTHSELYTSLQCLIEFDERYYDTYIEKYNSCRQHKAVHRDWIQNCNQRQKMLEEQKCYEQEYIHDACDNFNTCWSGTTGSHSQIASTTRDLENIFQKQWTALECLMCYGKQILEDTTDLTVCENAPPPQFACTPGSDTDRISGPGTTNSLAICYYEIEDKYDCESNYDDCVPGTPTWFGKYGDWAGSCAEVDECIHTCPQYGAQ